MKVYSKKNVFDSAMDRIRWVFKEFNSNVVCGFSGGKDSTVVMEMALMVVNELKEQGKLPKDYKLKVMWLDQEAEWTETCNYCKRVMQRPEIEFYRMQLPFRLSNNATLVGDNYLHCWDENIPDEQLCQPRDKDAYDKLYLDKKNKTGEYIDFKDRFHDIFENIYSWIFEGKPYAVLQGLKANENTRRNLQLTYQTGYKNITWSCISGINGEGVRFSPIYDWNNIDNWVAISKFGWDYNKVYDAMLQYGIPVNKLRVSSLIHETSVAHNSTIVQELDPKLYERMTQRLPGISTYSKLMEDAQKVELPPNFKDWVEYRDYLIEKLVPEENRHYFYEMTQTKFYKENHDDDVEKAIIESVLTMDIDKTKFKNMATARDLANRKKKKMEERENERDS